MTPGAQAPNKRPKRRTGSHSAWLPSKRVARNYLPLSEKA